MPGNWEQIWDARKIVSRQIKSPKRPFPYRHIYFVDESVELPSGALQRNPTSRILAVSATPFLSKRSLTPVKTVPGRGVVLVPPQGKAFCWFFNAAELPGGVDLAKINLRTPNITPKQLAEMFSTMFEFGFDPELIHVAMGKHELEVLRDSKLLDAGEQRYLEDVLAFGPAMPADRKFALMTWIPQPIVIVAVGLVVVVLCGAILFLLKRRILR